MRIHSLKTKKTTQTVFYVGDFKTALLSEATLYELGYLSEDRFQNNQDRYIAEAGRPVFGTVEVNLANCGDCALTKITKGNLS